MMKNILLQYMKDRVDNTPKNDDMGNNSSVLTISREYGCSARVIAEKIIALIEKKNGKMSEENEWLIINKGIIQKTAKELNLDPSFIKKVTNSGSKGIFDELIMSFSEDDSPSDIKIKETIADVIKKSSKDGNRIIIGRSGATILKDLNNKSLHIRLEGSEKFRSERLMKLHNLTEKDAKKRIKKTDINRKHIRNYFKRKHTSLENENCAFDVIYNCERFTKDEIAENIFFMMAMKKMV